MPHLYTTAFIDWDESHPDSRPAVGVWISPGEGSGRRGAGSAAGTGDNAPGVDMCGVQRHVRIGFVESRESSPYQTASFGGYWW